MRQLILIDGSSVLSTCFFGSARAYLMDKERNPQKLMQTQNGVYTNGVYTMTRILLNLIKKYGPSHLVVAWDVSRNTFRRVLYPFYKSHRGETDPALKSQFTLMQRLLDQAGIAQFRDDGFEADDILGTLAKRFEQEIPVVVITKDQDALQLVSENTRVWLQTSKSQEYRELFFGPDYKEVPYPVPDGFFEFTPITFEAIYGLQPIQMIDKKAIEGDKSDFIPGVKGVGEKAVVPLLQEYNTVDELYDMIEDMNKEEEAAFKELCKELGISRSPLTYLLKTTSNPEEPLGKDAAYLSKVLATIKTDIPFYDSLPLDDLMLQLNNQGLLDICRELEFNSLIEEISKKAVGKPIESESVLV